MPLGEEREIETERGRQWGFKLILLLVQVARDPFLDDGDARSTANGSNAFGHWVMLLRVVVF